MIINLSHVVIILDAYLLDERELVTHYHTSRMHVLYEYPAHLYRSIFSAIIDVHLRTLNNVVSTR